MILYFADRSMNILGCASTGLKSGSVITEDLKKENIDDGVTSFECKVSFDADNRLDVESWMEVGNSIFRYEGEEEERSTYTIDGSSDFYTIIESETSVKDKEVYAYGEDSGLTLLNDIAPPYTASSPMTCGQYVNVFLAGTGFSLNINESSEEQKKIEWTDSSTVLERLQDVVSQFGNELSFGFDIVGLRIQSRWVNVFQERGQNREEIVTINREVDNIIIKKSIANLATALLPTGANELTLSGYTYDDGDFYVTGKYLASVQALNSWARYAYTAVGGQSEGHIYKQFSCEAATQAELLAAAIEELKRCREPEINYEVDTVVLPPNTGIGDRINLVDDAGELYVSGRILELETSITENSKKITLGEYLIRDSGISAEVEELAARFAQTAKRTFYTWVAYADDENGSNISTNPEGHAWLGLSPNHLEEEVDISDPSIFTWSKVQGPQGSKGEDAVVLRIDSSRGTVFKNNQVYTILTVTIHTGGERITTLAGLHAKFGAGAYLQWSWQRMDEDRFGLISVSDSRLFNDGFALTLTPDDVDTKVTFMCEMITE